MSTAVRIFVASPGDRSEERALALEVLEHLPYDPFLRGRLHVEVIVWDKPGAGTPMPATMTPQEAIAEGLARPSERDVVVVILWSRIGTPCGRGAAGCRAARRQGPYLLGDRGPAGRSSGCWRG